MINDLKQKLKLAEVMVKLNHEVPHISLRREWKIGRLSIRFDWRSSKNLWGRFGGGWQWFLGFQAIYIGLLVCSLIISIEKKDKGNA